MQMASPEKRTPSIYVHSVDSMVRENAQAIRRALLLRPLPSLRLTL